jgi:hypothetical protein
MFSSVNSERQQGVDRLIPSRFGRSAPLSVTQLAVRICAVKVRGKKRFPIHPSLRDQTARFSRDQRASMPSPKDTSAAFIAASKRSSSRRYASLSNQQSMICFIAASRKPHVVLLTAPQWG